MCSVCLKVGTADCVLFSKMRMVPLLAVMVDVGVPKVAFHTPIDSVPPLSTVPPL